MKKEIQKLIDVYEKYFNGYLSDEFVEELRILEKLLWKDFALENRLTYEKTKSKKGFIKKYKNPKKLIDFGFAPNDTIIWDKGLKGYLWDLEAIVKNLSGVMNLIYINHEYYGTSKELGYYELSRKNTQFNKLNKLKNYFEKIQSGMEYFKDYGLISEYEAIIRRIKLRTKEDSDFNNSENKEWFLNINYQAKVHGQEK